MEFLATKFSSILFRKAFFRNLPFNYMVSNSEIFEESSNIIMEQTEEIELMVGSIKNINRKLTITYEVNNDLLSARWKKPARNMLFIQRLFAEGMSPKEVLAILLPKETFPEEISDEFALQIALELCKENLTREKLPQYNTFIDAVELLRKSKKILVLTGAGISVSCGIPDFRSANGIYARLHKDFPELPDPTAMFDMDFFRKNPTPFYNFAREIFPGQFRPSLSHMFIKFLESEGKLLRNYTQNIDTLEKVAGIERVVECHGSFSKSSCLTCKHTIDSTEIKEDVFEQRVPYCKVCKTGVIKPNIVFFGEDLNDEFHIQMGEDQENVDLLVVIGSSLKVHPVALIPFNMSPDVPQILINREQLTKYKADIKLLGNCDDILVALSLAMGGSIQNKMMEEIKQRMDQKDLYDMLITKFKSEGKSFQEMEPIFPTLLNPQQFKELIDNDAVDLTEPQAKRRHIENEMASGTDLKGDTKAEILNTNTSAEMWQSNYVSVESVLPPNHTLLVPPNIQVFKGGVLFYERDNDTFCRQAGSHLNQINEFDEEHHNHTANACNHTYYSSSEDFSNNGSSSVDSDDQSFNSLPATLNNSSDTTPLKRARSCSPTLYRDEKSNLENRFLDKFFEIDDSTEWTPKNR